MSIACVGATRAARGLGNPDERNGHEEYYGGNVKDVVESRHCGLCVDDSVEENIRARIIDLKKSRHPGDEKSWSNYVDRQLAGRRLTAVIYDPRSRPGG